MKLSSKARYGLKACLALAENYNENQPLALPVFAEKAGVTEAYMEQIVILLKKADIVESVRGAGGGYYLKKSPKDIKVGSVLRALEDGLEFIDCINTPCEGGEECKARRVWNKIYKSMNLVLDSLTLDDLLHDQKRYIYLDHSATTAVDEEVLSKMLPYFYEKAGNASSQHGMGRDAEVAVDRARKQVADAIGAKSNEIYFTSGGSESDNWALKGIAHAYKSKGKHLITSEFEHPAVLNTMKQLEAEGFEVSYLHTNPQGYVSVDELESIIRPDTILVSVMYANNEIGTIQPIEELAKVAHAHGAFFHTDAVQAIGNVHIDVKAQGIDMLSMSAHKFYGPKGIGCLYIKSGVRPERLIAGGEQERNQRAGTTNTPGVVGIGFAIEKAVNNMDENNAYIAALRDEFVKEVKERIPDIRYNGGEKRLAGNAHFTFRYIEGESILFTLDLAGICASSGSACSSGSLEASKTVLAIGVPAEEAHGSIRFTFGRENTMDDVKYTVGELEKTVKRLRSMSPLFAESTAKITMI